MRIDLTFSDRHVAFDMGYDPMSIADVTTKHLFERDNACEPEVMHLMNRVLRLGDVAVDIGANIGVFTLFMSRLVGDSGQVLAFEPGSNNISKLRENVKLNGMMNVEIHTVPLWSRNEEVVLYLRHDSGMNSLRSDEQALSRSRLIAHRLDEYCATVRPRLIKIDVEGAEAEVLLGGKRTLLAPVPYIICELNQGALALFNSTQKDLRELMRSYGYEMFVLNGNGSMPIHVPRETKVESRKPNLNVLFSSLLDVSQAYPEIRCE